MQLNQAQFLEWLENFIELSTEYKNHLTEQEVNLIWEHLKAVDTTTKSPEQESESTIFPTIDFEKILEDMEKNRKDSLPEQTPWHESIQPYELPKVWGHNGEKPHQTMVNNPDTFVKLLEGML